MRRVLQFYQRLKMLKISSMSLMSAGLVGCLEAVYGGVDVVGNKLELAGAGDVAAGASGSLGFISKPVAITVTRISS